MRRVYLDHAATTPVHPEVMAAMADVMATAWGNPSSLHSFGREARERVERARDAVAALIGCEPAEVVFTSGGTEADNLAIIGSARYLRHAGKGDHLVVSAVEHHAVLDACRYLERHEGFRLTVLPVDGRGMVGVDEFQRALVPGTILASVMLANNEMGAIQPVRELAAAARQRGVVFHTDAVQAVGQIPVDVRELGVDLLSLSAHKFYGPKGIGALYVRRGCRLDPLFLGGGQERRRRPGTENVPGIVGLGVAAELAWREGAPRAARIRELRDRFLAGLRQRIPGLLLNGPEGDHRLPGNLNVTVLGVDAEAALINLDLKGVAASSGSACAAGSQEPSHVILALGRSPDEARGALRFSLGRGTTEEDVDYVLEVLPPIVERLRRLAGYSPAAVRGAG